MATVTIAADERASTPSSMPPGHAAENAARAEQAVRAARKERKEVRKQEIVDALKQCKIHLSDNEMRLMTREVDQDFITREALQHAEYEKKRRDEKISKNRGGRLAPIDSLLSDGARDKFAGANHTIKTQTSDVRILRSALDDLNRDNLVSLSGAIHPGNRRQRSLLNRSKGAAVAGTSTEEERQQLLVANAIARVKSRQKTADNRLKECYNVAIALSGREPGSPKATDRHVTDSAELGLIFREVDVNTRSNPHHNLI